MTCAEAIRIACRGAVTAVLCGLWSGCASAQAPAPESAYPRGPGSLAGLWLKSGYRNLTLDHFRQIQLNARHPVDPDPTYMGHSIGRWEGDTLVVDTVGLVESTPIDWLGTPHSADLHLIERYRRAGKDTLELLLTIDDPRTFTRRWDARQVFRAAPASMTLTEYICENNRDAPGDH